MKSITVLSSLFMLVGLCLIGPAQAETSKAKQHLLLSIERNPTGFVIQSQTVVQSPLPKRRAGTARPRGDWRVCLRDAEDKTLFEQRIPDPSLLRGKFHGKAQPTHIKRQPPYAFALRLPLLDSKHILLEALDSSQTRKLHPPESAWHELGRLDFPEVRP